jgi:hypothetical protein
MSAVPGVAAGDFQRAWPFVVSVVRRDSARIASLLVLQAFFVFSR